MTDITKGLAALAKAQAEVSRQEAEEERARMQAYRERLAAAEIETKRTVFNDGLRGMGLEPGVLEESLRHYVFLLDDALKPTRPFETARVESRNPSFTPNLAKRARQRALDHLDLLNPRHRAMQIEKAETEARAHHVHVTAHEKRCTHAEVIGPKFSTWRLLDVTEFGSVRQRCAQCRLVRQLDDTPETFERTAAEFYRAEEQVSVGGKRIGFTTNDVTMSFHGGPNLCTHRYVRAAVSVMPPNTDPTVRRSIVCAACGASMGSVGADLGYGDDLHFERIVSAGGAHIELRPVNPADSRSPRMTAVEVLAQRDAATFRLEQSLLNRPPALNIPLAMVDMAMLPSRSTAALFVSNAGGEIVDVVRIENLSTETHPPSCSVWDGDGRCSCGLDQRHAAGQ